MYCGFYEEFDKCPECSNGKLQYVREGSCSCHICAPCSSCVNKVLECDNCGWQLEDEPEYKDVAVTPPHLGAYISERIYKPSPLDNTKIDYRIKAHTASSQICEGVYPEGTSSAEVEKIVRGSFGGRFESFGNGRFKYIAYTD